MITKERSGQMGGAVFLIGLGLLFRGNIGGKRKNE